MKVFGGEGGYLVRLDSGEEVCETLVKFARAERVHAATLSGIGSVKNVTLGFYDVRAKKYQSGFFAGPHELVSLSGNIAWEGELPIVHLHALVADKDFKPLGGHLLSGETTATVEVAAMLLPMRMERATDPRLQLKVLAEAKQRPDGYIV